MSNVTKSTEIKETLFVVTWGLSFILLSLCTLLVFTYAFIRCHYAEGLILEKVNDSIGTLQDSHSQEIHALCEAGGEVARSAAYPLILIAALWFLMLRLVIRYYKRQLDPQFLSPATTSNISFPKPSCTKLDMATIAGMSDDQLADTVGQIAQWRCASNPKHSEELLAGLSAGFLTVGTVWIFESEVMGGGLQCYFGNTEGRMAESAAEAYRAFGLSQAADVLDSARSLWQKEKAGASNLDEQYRQLDIRFYETGVTDESKGRMASFIRQHPEDFVIDIEDL